jgi:myosin heavy subunit
MDVALGLASRGLDDLVLLDGIDEENVQRTLESRFKNEGSMYTRIGPVLIAMNPYKILTVAGKPIYDESLIDAYRGRLYYEMPPHIFAVAEAAYTDLLRFRREQSIIISGTSAFSPCASVPFHHSLLGLLCFPPITRHSICPANHPFNLFSGESGAGKTEACKQCLCFISRVSGAYVQAAQQQTKPGMKAPPVSSSVAAAMRVKDRLVTSTLVLESFGNAATVRNDNSSRFGKLMTVNFKSSGMASAGSIRIYLLEKNRVVRQQEGERNFHIFHQLTAGANAEQRRQFMIQQPSAYAYLANEERKIPSVNDTNQFRAVSACFNLLCIPQDTQNTIWKVVSTVLNLGNIDFTSGQDEDKERDQRQKGSSGSVVPGGGSPQILDGADGFVDDVGTGTPSSTAKGGVINDDAAKVVDSGTSLEAQKAVATLLGVSPEDVEKALTTRTLVIRGSETQALQTTAQARTARDSLAKALYSKLFDYVVGEVNKSISGIHDGNTQPSHAAAAAKPKGKTGSVVSVASAASKASNKNTMEQTATTATAAKTGPHGDSPPPNTASLAEEESDAQAMEKVREEEEQQLRLQQQQADEEEETRNLAMHLLDLYGFEDLACNKFDQLCINYVNERLQQLFIEATLRTEQQVYEQEGIEWTPIDYFDNQIVVTLLDGKGGLFPLLDDSAAIADSSPTKLMQTLNKQLGKHPHYVAPKLANDSFTVKHYAGEISYSASAGEGMVIANRDILNNSLLALLNNSPGIPVLQELFRDKRTKEEKCKRPPTAGLQFRVSVNALIEVLSVCHPHYVRYVLPLGMQPTYFFGFFSAHYSILVAHIIVLMQLYQTQ